MFTGIIKETGRVISVVKKDNGAEFIIQTNEILKNKNVNESIAVNGVCTTITDIKDKTFTFFAIPETLTVTNLGLLKKDDEVNLEPALTLKQGLDGHLVQGHVDCMGDVLALEKSDRVILRIQFPEKIQNNLAYKGSITINGVSLTISELLTKSFSTELIPHTLKMTNLGQLKRKDKVNLEVDIISKYIEKMLGEKENESKYEFLKERGFI